MSALVWSPVYKIIEERISSGDDIILLIVPFVKLGALQQLHWVRTKDLRLKVISRWRPDDLLAGASDVEIYPFLRDAGCELYVNSDVHMKLYVFGSNTAFNTSANLTLHGLGYSDTPNIEVGNAVILTSEDWAKIYEIVASSRQVDDAIYERFRKFVEDNRVPGTGRLPPDLLGPAKAYTIASLPATFTPQKLAEYYFRTGLAEDAAENVRRAVHDLVTYKIPRGLTREQFDAELGKAFRNTPFVKDFIQLLKKESNLRFGAVNNWIHQKCEDVPLPYRWEIKENTHIFYDWLAHYVPEISWDRPRHSQVIHWNAGHGTP
jgi:hypothetical protein